MKIEMKISCKEITEGLREGVYELDEGTDISGLIDAAAKESGVELEESVKKCFIFLVNGMPDEWERVLNDGDLVRVLYKILGG